MPRRTDADASPCYKERRSWMLCWLLVLLASVPAHAMRFVKAIGASSATAAGTSIAVGVPADGVAAGNSVILAASITVAAGAVSCSDSKGNTYTVDLNVNSGSSHIIVCAAHNITALASGDSITLSHPSVATRAVSALEFSGISSGTPLDKTASATGSSTTPSSGATATTTSAKQLILGVVGTNGRRTTTTFTAGTFFTAAGRWGTDAGGAGPNQVVAPEYRVVQSTGTYSATATITSGAWTAGVVTYKVDASGMDFADTFESGTLLTSDGPAGKWTSKFTNTGLTLTASASAAHRGSYGLFADDTTAVDAAAGLRFDGTSTTGSHYLRFWFQLKATNTFTGNVDLAKTVDLTPRGLNTMNLENVGIPNLEIQGQNNAGTWQAPAGSADITTGTWYLVELVTTGVGTASGSRQLWFNGTLQLSQSSIDWSAQSTSWMEIGPYNSDDGSFIGQVYFDDVRLTGDAPASKFSVSTNVGTHNIGQCNPVTVSLLDSSNASATAPYAFSAELAVSGVTGTYYSNDTCSSSTTTVDFASGASSAQTYLKASTAGTATLTASYIDFLDGSTTMSVSTPSAISLESFGARATSRGVALEWKTATEFQNLGFRIHREMNGHKELLTREMIFGAGLLVGPSTQLWGRSYSWLDARPPGNLKTVRYWLESVDLDGTSSWYGPTTPQGKSSGALLQSLTQSLDSAEPPLPPGLPTAVAQRRTARVAPSTPPSLEAQWRILGAPALKIQVKEEGWYRVEASELAQHGFGNVTANLLQLYVDGREVPIVTTPFGGVEFFGLGIDSPYSASRTYWLTVGQSPGKRIEQQPTLQPTGDADFSMHTLEYKERTLYFAALNNGDAENFFGPLVSGDKPLALNFPIQQLATDAAVEAHLVVKLQGVTPVNHRVDVSLNETSLGEFEFFALGNGLFNIPVPLSVLREGDNTLSLAALGGSLDRILVDSVVLNFPQKASVGAQVDRRLLPAGLSTNLSGFGASPQAYDVSSFDEPKQLALSGSSLVPPGEGNRHIQLVSSQTARAVASIALRSPSAWHLLDNVDFVILSHENFIPGLQPLVDRRRAQGWRVAVVDVSDVYDEFSFGNHSPLAIRDFLHHVRKASPSLSHVLLVGDASLDPKNLLGKNREDFVPTRQRWLGILESASDDWFADFDDDGLPELAVGRFPVQTTAQLAALVQKTLDFETAAANEAWRRQGLLVVGASEASELDASRAEIQGAAASSFHLDVLDAASSVAPPLNEALQGGHFLVNYLGHGAANSWKQMLSAADVPSFFQGPPSLLVAMTCLNGFFHDLYSDSLAELLVNQPSGGAAVVWASSALTYPEGQAPANIEFLRALADRTLSLGQVAQRAKAATPNAVVQRSFILFGDPTLFGTAPPKAKLEPALSSPSSSGCGGCSGSPVASVSGIALALLSLAGLRRRRGG